MPPPSCESPGFCQRVSQPKKKIAALTSSLTGLLLIYSIFAFYSPPPLTMKTGLYINSVSSAFKNVEQIWREHAWASQRPGDSDLSGLRSSESLGVRPHPSPPRNVLTFNADH